MSQALPAIEHSLSAKIQHQISESLNISREEIFEFFKVLHIPDSGVFVCDVINRVAALKTNFIDRIDDELDPVLVKIVKLAQKSIDSGVLMEITNDFCETSVEGLLKRRYKNLKDKRLIDNAIYGELHGNCTKNPLFMIFVYPVYVGDFGQEHQEALSNYFMILGAILNQHLKNQNKSKKDESYYEKSMDLLYQFSLDVRKFDIHLGDKLSLLHCRSIKEIVEQLRSAPHSSSSRESLLKFARFIEGKTKAKTYLRKNSETPKNFDLRKISRGVVKVHDNFFIDEIEFDDDTTILILDQISEEDKHLDNDCFVIPVEDPRLPKIFSEKGLNGYHRKYQNFIFSPITISDTRTLLALLWKISRSSGVLTKSDLKAVIFTLLSMITGSNPKNISTPKKLKEHEGPVLGRINFKVLSRNRVQIFFPVLTANTSFAEGLDCYEDYSPFFEFVLPKVFSNLLFHALKRYEKEFHGESLAFDHHVGKAIKKILKSVKGAGLTLPLVIKNTILLFHEASNGSAYIAHCLTNHSNSLAATQKHYASISKETLTKVFNQVIQNQFAINIEPYFSKKTFYLGNHSLLKQELLREKLTYYYDRSVDEKTLAVSQFNNLQRYFAFIQFIFSAGRNVKSNKPFHDFFLDQRLPLLYEKNRKPKSINLFFWDDKCTKNGSNVRFPIAPPNLDGLLDLEQKLIKKLQKEQVIFDVKQQFFEINNHFKLEFLMQSDLAKLDFDEGVRPNFLRSWVFSTLLNEVMKRNSNISAETLDAFMGHGHAGSEFWNPYSLKDPQVSFQEQIRFVELLVTILKIPGDKS